MKSKIKFIVIILWIFLIQVEGFGQFRFGVCAGPVFTQVNGDNLSGFNKVGISFGLLGGYKLNESNSIVIDLGYQRLGSNRGAEKIPSDLNRILLETELSTINILLGYQFHFGNRWDGKKFYTLKAGLNYHRIVKISNAILTRNFSIEEEAIPEDQFSNQYLAVHVSLGRFLADRFAFSMGVDFGLSNLLIKPQYNIQNIAPYHLFGKFSYYIF